MRWHRMEESEVEEVWEGFKNQVSPFVASFIYFLSEDSGIGEDFKIKKGEVYRRVEDE